VLLFHWLLALRKSLQSCIQRNNLPISNANNTGWPFHYTPTRRPPRAHLSAGVESDFVLPEYLKNACILSQSGKSSGLRKVLLQLLSASLVACNCGANIESSTGWTTVSQRPCLQVIAPAHIVLRIAFTSLFSSPKIITKPSLSVKCG